MLSRLVVALRMKIFARINGEEGITVPGSRIDADSFLRVYADRAADGRSRGAALSNLFWYWLSPGAHLHQEHLEPGPVYDEVARCTRRFLAVSHRDAAALARRCAARELAGRRPGFVRLRDLVMPIWAAFHYELVFGVPCPPRARRLIVDNANDVVTALKCCGLRHMSRRHRLTAYLHAAVRAGLPRHPLPSCFTSEEQALYLQGVYFNTAVVQMSEATAHLLMVLATHGTASFSRHPEHVIDETLRLYPLFGIAHRITSAPLVVSPTDTLPAGTVLCFDYPTFHRTGFASPADFDPTRWERLSRRDAHHIPFGVAANRPCPARGLAPLTMREVARVVLETFSLHTAAAHTRSLPNRGPCVLLRPGSPRPRGRLAWLRWRDRFEDVWRSVVQLVRGTSMVLAARRQRLCDRHFSSLQGAGHEHADKVGP